MSDESPIINKVASSGIVSLDLEELYPQGERVIFDLKPLLWQEIALKEDDLRAFVKTHDWSQYSGQFVSVHCSADAIIPRGPTCLSPRICSLMQPSLRRAIRTNWSAPSSRASCSS